MCMSTREAVRTQPTYYGVDKQIPTAPLGLQVRVVKIIKGIEIQHHQVIEIATFMHGLKSHSINTLKT